MDNLGFVVAGYLLTAAVLAGYATHLFYRSRRAAQQAAALLDSRRH